MCPEGDTGQDHAVDFLSPWVSFVHYIELLQYACLVLPDCH